jgi:hypothetical protein
MFMALFVSPMNTVVKSTSTIADLLEVKAMTESSAATAPAPSTPPTDGEEKTSLSNQTSISYVTSQDRRRVLISSIIEVIG